MRIVFMGTPAFAVPTLDALVAAGHEVVAVYTQPPRPGGRRGRERVASPVQRQAEALGIEVRSPARLRGGEEQAAFAALGADVAVVAAYGLILPQPVLDAPRHGCLNVHASLLPRWRGAAPIQRAILAGDAETGVCIMRMEAGLDTGPVLLEGRVSIADKDAGVLTEQLAHLGAALMVEVLADLPHRIATPQPEAGVTYAAKVDKAEARLDLARSADEAERQVRAFAPVPGAWFEVRGERVKVLAAAALRHPSGSGDRSGESATDAARDPSVRWGDDRGRGGGETGVVLDDRLTITCCDGTAIRPTLVQRAGRGITTAAELLRGFPIPPGTRL